jgi:hypothetical protein
METEVWLDKVKKPSGEMKVSTPCENKNYPNKIPKL